MWVHCPCGRSTELDDALAGRSVAGPACRRGIDVPRFVPRPARRRPWRRADLVVGLVALGAALAAGWALLPAGWAGRPATPRQRAAYGSLVADVYLGRADLVRVVGYEEESFPAGRTYTAADPRLGRVLIRADARVVLVYDALNPSGVWWRHRDACLLLGGRVVRPPTADEPTLEHDRATGYDRSKVILRGLGLDPDAQPPPGPPRPPRHEPEPLFSRDEQDRFRAGRDTDPGPAVAAPPRPPDKPEFIGVARPPARARPPGRPRP